MLARDVLRRPERALRKHRCICNPGWTALSVSTNLVFGSVTRRLGQRSWESAQNIKRPKTHSIAYRRDQTMPGQGGCLGICQ
jgi:hypothetical protein